VQLTKGFQTACKDHFVLSRYFKKQRQIRSGGLRVGGSVARLKRGLYDDVIILGQP